MAAYIIVECVVTDYTAFSEFSRRTAAAVEAHGGRYLVDGEVEVLDGDWSSERMVIVEFGDSGQARAWLDSPAYRELRVLRQKAAKDSVVFAEGVGARRWKSMPKSSSRYGLPCIVVGITR